MTPSGGHRRLDRPSGGLARMTRGRQRRAASSSPGRALIFGRKVGWSRSPQARCSDQVRPLSVFRSGSGGRSRASRWGSDGLRRRSWSSPGLRSYGSSGNCWSKPRGPGDATAGDHVLRRLHRPVRLGDPDLTGQPRHLFVVDAQRTAPGADRVLRSARTPRLHPTRQARIREPEGRESAGILSPPRPGRTMPRMHRVLPAPSSPADSRPRC